MLALCSNGLTSEAILSALRPQIAPGQTAALVVTADNVYRERNYHVPRCLDELTGLGLTVDVRDIDTDPCAELERFDVVEFIGGNPFYLLSALRRVKAGAVLRHLAERKLLIGWSAAAFAFGPTLELVNAYSPEMNEVGLKDLTALGLTEVQVLPHYERFLTRFDRFEETCAAYEAARGVRVVRLNDGDAVLVEGSRVDIVRSRS